MRNTWGARKRKNEGLGPQEILERLIVWKCLLRLPSGLHQEILPGLLSHSVPRYGSIRFSVQIEPAVNRGSRKESPAIHWVAGIPVDQMHHTRTKLRSRLEQEPWISRLHLRFQQFERLLFLIWGQHPELPQSLPNDGLRLTRALALGFQNLFQHLDHPFFQGILG